MCNIHFLAFACNMYKAPPWFLWCTASFTCPAGALGRAQGWIHVAEAVCKARRAVGPQQALGPALPFPAASILLLKMLIICSLFFSCFLFYFILFLCICFCRSQGAQDAVSRYALSCNTALQCPYTNAFISAAFSIQAGCTSRSCWAF